MCFLEGSSGIEPHLFCPVPASFKKIRLFIKRRTPHPPISIKYLITNIHEGLILDRQDAIGMLGQAVHGQDRVVRRSDDVIAVQRRIDTSNEAVDIRELVGENAEDPRSDATSGPAAHRMQHEETAEGVATLRGFPQHFRDVVWEEEEVDENEGEMY